MMTPLGPWLPDQMQFNAAAALDVKNVIPSGAGYLPFPSFGNVATALASRPRGAATFRSTTGVVHNFCGDDTKLYKLATDGLSFTDVSRTVGGAYAVAADGWWTFTQFGDQVIASNNVDATQVYDMAAGGNFAALAGSPPIAAFTGSIRDFVVLARVNTAYNRIQWSGINDSTDWTAPPNSTMSDSQDFPDGGIIKGFVGGEYGVVFQERSIQRMAFEGPPTIFRFDKISNTLGCWIETSIAAYENMIFFCAHDGFYMVRGGSEITAIGNEKVDRWFSENVNATYNYRASAAIDPVRKLYLFSFASSASGDGTPDVTLIYHWPTGQWSKVEGSHSLIFTASPQASYTMDGLDALSATADGLVYPFDSLFYTGSGNLVMAGFDTSFRMGFYNGLAMEATVETGDVQLTPGRKTLLRGMRPMIEGDGASITATLRWRDRLQDAWTTGSAVTANSNGYCAFRTNARYHRARLVIPASAIWTRVTGLDDLKFSAMGAR